MRAGRPPPPLAHLLGPLGSHAAPMWGRWELLPPPCKVSVCAPHYSGNTGPPRRQESKGTVSKRTVPKRTVRRASSHNVVPLSCRRVCFKKLLVSVEIYFFQWLLSATDHVGKADEESSSPQYRGPHRSVAVVCSFRLSSLPLLLFSDRQRAWSDFSSSSTTAPHPTSRCIFIFSLFFHG